VVTSIADTRVLFHEQPTNGIVYFDVGLDLHTLPAEFLPYVSLFGRALLETGAGDMDFVQLSRRIGGSTGGIVARTFTSAVEGSDTAAAWMLLRTKAMPEKADELLAILHDVLTRARLDNRERIQQLVLEEKSQIESSIPFAGSRYASLRLLSGLNEAGWAAEQMAGVSHLAFLRALADRIDRDWNAVHADLERIRETLVTRSTMICNVTTDAGNWSRFQPRLTAFLGRLPNTPAGAARWSVPAKERAEGLTIPTKVNYVVKGGDVRRLGLDLGGATAVIQQYLNTTWLWSKVRVQGGAYGGSCALDRRAGALAFSSYRDPNLLETLRVYDETSAFLRDADISAEEVTRSIVGVIGQVDDYLLPDAKGLVSLRRYLLGETEERLQRVREEILSARVEDFRSFGAALSRLAEEARVVVVGSPEAIAAANAGRNGFLEVSKVL
jgi:Zn-dependent M16 (insulinase) family peptidase